MLRSKRLGTLGSWLALLAMLTLALPLQGGAAPLRAMVAEGMGVAGGSTVVGPAAGPAAVLPPCHLAAATDALAMPSCEHAPDSTDGCHCVQWAAMAVPGLLPLRLAPSAPPRDTVILSLPPRFVAADIRPPIPSLR